MNMNIESLADESRKKRMTTPKELSGTISEHSGKSECLTDKADVSCTSKVNTGDTYYNYEMHALTSFYVRATNDE